MPPDGLDHVRDLGLWLQQYPDDRDTRHALQDLLNPDANGPELRDWAWMNLRGDCS